MNDILCFLKVDAMFDQQYSKLLQQHFSNNMPDKLASEDVLFGNNWRQMNIDKVIPKREASNHNE